jgi:DNA-binding CsgD family transcriptional regulator
VTDDHGTTRARSRALSERQREIVGMLAAGQSGAQIAETLVLSPETVRTHIRNAMTKLGASSRAQAVALAISQNEVDGGVTPAPNSVLSPSGEGGHGAAGSHAAARAALAAGEWDASLTALLAEVLSLYDVEGGVIFLTDEDGLSLRQTIVLGESLEDSNAYPGRVPLGEGPLGRAALEHRATIVHGSGTNDAEPGRATICAPMTASGRAVGVICLTTRPSRVAGRGELLLLQAFVNRVGEILLAGGGNQTRRLKEAVDRFRASWSSVTDAV